MKLCCFTYKLYLLVKSGELNGDNFVHIPTAFKISTHPHPHPNPVPHPLPILDTLVKNRNLCHKTISNLQYKPKHLTHRQTQYEHIINSPSHCSDKAVCSARHEALQEDKLIDRLRIQLSPSPFLRHYRCIFSHYDGISVMFVAVIVTTAIKYTHYCGLPWYFCCPQYCTAL